jgi:hypothetical protein
MFPHNCIIKKPNGTIRECSVPSESATIIVNFFSSVAHVWVPGAKSTGPIVKVWFFFNLIFSAVRNFKFRHMVCRNKKFCSVKPRFLVHLPWSKFRTILALYRLFLGRFQWNFQIIKISKNKICHFWQAPLAATGPLWKIFFITEWIALKLKILTDIKIRFSQSACSFCSRYTNMCDRTKQIYNRSFPVYDQVSRFGQFKNFETHNIQVDNLLHIQYFFKLHISDCWQLQASTARGIKQILFKFSKPTLTDFKTIKYNFQTKSFRKTNKSMKSSTFFETFFKILIKTITWIRKYYNS